MFLPNINVNIRMDRELKQQAEKLFSSLGLNMTTAVNIFMRQAVKQGGIPFRVLIEDEEKKEEKE